MTVIQDVQKLEAGSLIEVFKLDATDIGGQVIRFHQHTQFGSIWWKGEEYLPYPVKTEGFTRSSDKPSTPKLAVANVNGYVSQLCLAHDDLLGAPLTRYRTLGTYLDAVNFTDGPNLAVNGDLRDDTTGWTVTGGTFNWLSQGQARLSGTPAVAAKAYQDIPVVSGTQYLIKVRIISKIATASVKAYNGAAFTTQLGTSMSTVGTTNYITITPTTTTLRLSIEAGIDSEILVSGIEVHKYVGNASANPSEEFTPEIWYIERKTAETNEVVEFELVSALDLNGVRLPRRQIIQNYCTWLSLDGYRGANCGYTGIAVAKADGTPTSSMAEDACGGKLSDCKLRQWPDGVLNFGGFPAAGLMRT